MITIYQLSSSGKTKSNCPMYSFQEDEVTSAIEKLFDSTAAVQLHDDDFFHRVKTNSNHVPASSPLSLNDSN